MSSIFDYIKSSVNIVDVIEKFSNITLTNVGNGKYRGHHPVHDSESKMSLHVDGNEGTFYCWNCRKGGSCLDYVMSLDETLSLYDAAVKIAEAFNINIYDNSWTPEQIKHHKERQHKIQSVEKCFLDAVNFYHNELGDKRSYFHERGITDETIDGLKLGYAPDNWTILERYLKGKGHDRETMMSTGLLIEQKGRNNLRPYFYNRYIFTYFKNTRPCYLSGRDASEGYYTDRVTGKKVEVPKYIKLKITDKVDHEVIQHQLWGVNRLRSPKRVFKQRVNVKVVDKNGSNGSDKGVIHETVKVDPPHKIIVTEGIIDAILSYQELSKYGWVTISPTTSDLSSADLHDIIDVIEENPRCEIVFCFDSDESGKKGAWRSAKHCNDAVFYRLAHKYFTEVLQAEIDPSNIEDHLRALEARDKDYKSMMDWIIKRRPIIKIATIPKPEDIDKIDLSDLFMMQKTNEVLYWIEASRTVSVYDMKLSGNPLRFFKDKKFEPKRLSDEICMDGRIFHSIKDEIYEYEDGIYLECETRLKRDINLALKDFRSVRINNETIQDLKNTYGTETGDIFVQEDIINFDNGLMAVSRKSQDFILSIPTSKHIEGSMFTHTPHIPMLSQIPIQYNHKSECPEIDKFISEIVSVEDVPILYELVGYCMHSSTDMEKAFILLGEGSNGKSTYLKLVEKLLGARNISHVTMQDLDASRFRYAEIFGKLANIYADIPITPLSKVDRFNAVVTGDIIQAERKGKDPFEFTPYSTLIFSCNIIPKSHTKTEGYYRRIIPVKFPYKFGSDSDDDVDKQRESQSKLIDRISTTEELQGFAKSALEYYSRAYKRGEFSISEQSDIEMEEYKKTNQPEIDFLKDDMWCVIGHECRVGSTELYDAYKTYLEELNPRLKPVSANEFYKTVLNTVPNSKKYRGRWNGRSVNLFDGIGLVNLVDGDESEYETEEEYDDGISL